MSTSAARIDAARRSRFESVAAGVYEPLQRDAAAVLASQTGPASPELQAIYNEAFGHWADQVTASDIWPCRADPTGP